MKKLTYEDVKKAINEAWKEQKPRELKWRFYGSAETVQRVKKMFSEIFQEEMKNVKGD